MKNYGVPYKGSKSRIAKQIVDCLPYADNFYDLFAGGCAVTHAAMESGKYDNFVINDIDGRGCQLFTDAIQGKCRNRTEWISREEFHDKKATDPFIAIVWSFNNDMNTYIYGAEIEEAKHALHKYIVDNDNSYLSSLGIIFDNFCPYPVEQVHKRRLWTVKEVQAQLLNLKRVEMENLENFDRANGLEGGRLQELERCNHLQHLESLQRLESLRGDYREVEIKPNSVVYCDIPYKGTNTGGYDAIDYEAFYEWAESIASDDVKVFISEYDMPRDRFDIFTYFELRQLSTTYGATEKVKEYIFEPKGQKAERLGQMTLFDFIGV